MNVCVSVCVFSEGEANVTFGNSLMSVSEDDGMTMLCSNLLLTDGFTLETTVTAEFAVDLGDTGCYIVYNTQNNISFSDKIIPANAGRLG